MERNTFQLQGGTISDDHSQFKIDEQSPNLTNSHVLLNNVYHPHSPQNSLVNYVPVNHAKSGAVNRFRRHIDSGYSSSSQTPSPDPFPHLHLMGMESNRNEPSDIASSVNDESCKKLLKRFNSTDENTYGDESETVAKVHRVEIEESVRKKNKVDAIFGKTSPITGDHGIHLENRSHRASASPKHYQDINLVNKSISVTPSHYQDINLENKSHSANPKCYKDISLKQRSPNASSNCYLDINIKQTSPSTSLNCYQHLTLEQTSPSPNCYQDINIKQTSPSGSLNCNQDINPEHKSHSASPNRYQYMNLEQSRPDASPNRYQNINLEHRSPSGSANQYQEINLEHRSNHASPKLLYNLKELRHTVSASDSVTDVSALMGPDNIKPPPLVAIQDMVNISPKFGGKSGKKCDVCGEAAHGNFFGAIVCLPCKTFFIRCTTEDISDFRCRQGNSNCDVRGVNRSRCKYCRYKKCLDFGMNRKERPEKVILLDGQQMCKVCSDVANGIHFGIVSCEGCKKFFKRSLNELGSYICKYGGNCAINPRTRNDCRYCRFKRCCQVGMSTNAIKMGRPRKSMLIDEQYLDKPAFPRTNNAPLQHNPDNYNSTKSINNFFLSNSWNDHREKSPCHQHCMPPVATDDSGSSSPTVMSPDGSHTSNQQIGSHTTNQQIGSHTINQQVGTSTTNRNLMTVPFSQPVQEHAGWKECSHDIEVHINSGLSKITGKDFMPNRIPTDEHLVEIKKEYNSIGSESVFQAAFKATAYSPKDGKGNTSDAASLDSNEVQFSNLNCSSEAQIKDWDNKAGTSQARKEYNMDTSQSIPHKSTAKSQEEEEEEEGNTTDNNEVSNPNPLPNADELFRYSDQYWSISNHIIQAVSLNSVHQCNNELVKVTAAAYIDLLKAFTNYFDICRNDELGFEELRQKRFIHQVSSVIDFIRCVPGFDGLPQESKYMILRIAAIQVYAIVAAVHLYNPVTEDFIKDFFFEAPVAASHPRYKFQKAFIEFCKSLHLHNLDNIEAAFMCAVISIASDLFDTKMDIGVENLRKDLLLTFNSYVRLKYGGDTKRLQTLFGVVPALRRLGCWHYKLSYSDNVVQYKVKPSKDEA